MSISNVDKESLEVRAGSSSVAGIQTWRQELVRGVLWFLVIVGGLAVVSSSYNAFVEDKVALIPFYVGGYGVILVITFWRRISYAVQAGMLLFLIYGLGVLGLIEAGLSGDGRIFLLTFPMLAALFFGRRAGIGGLVLTILTMIAFGWMFSSGRLSISVAQQANTTDWVAWLSGTIILLMLGSLLVISLDYLLPRLANALGQSRRLAEELEEQRAQLEAQVRERTAGLASRNAQLAAAAEVAREAAEIRDIEQLLTQAVNLISDRFGFYHTGIFLLDDTGMYAELRATSSEGGRQMLARGHRLKVGATGIVGYVTGRGEPRIALDVGEDAAYFDNPDLPETRSEMALPLQVLGEVIGALDVQSKQSVVFTQEDVTILQTLADQVAVAIENARLLAESEVSLEAMRRAYGEISRESWRELLSTQTGLRAIYDPQDVLVSEDVWHAWMKRALAENRSIEDTDGEDSVLAVPLKVRGQVIGVLDAHKPKDDGEWTPEQVELMETLSDQLSTALENARLYQDTQRRAARERLIGEAAARFRESLDLERVLKAAASEVKQALALNDVVIRLGKPDEDMAKDIE
jgi:GAF domain-containing protein